jgi:DNA-binding MarR family transcriptional regulator
MQPSATLAAWGAMLRTARHLAETVEAEVKAAGFLPLAWFDVLTELWRAPKGRLSPRDLEQKTLLAQYNVSRLLDRMEREGLVARIAVPDDRRRQLVEITGPGRFMRKAMWPLYMAAIERHFGSRLTEDEAVTLASLLGKALGQTAPLEE